MILLNRLLYHFFRTDIDLGMAIAQGLGINPEQAMPSSIRKKRQQWLK